LGYVPIVGWVLFVANFFWTMAYDTIYAMVDRDDDLKIGIRSSAISFGRFDVLAVGISYMLLMVSLLVVGQSLPGPGSSHRLYWLGWLITIGICAILTWRIRNRDPEDCFAAFRANNYVGMPIWATLMLQLGWDF
jgi:4-hydroxybenzoate polyprenyltransferase